MLRCKVGTLGRKLLLLLYNRYHVRVKTRLDYRYTLSIETFPGGYEL